jgi:hypothetical protein
MEVEMLYNYWKNILKMGVLLLGITILLEGHAFG